MSTDRELLELAAKAAGYEVARVADDGRSLVLVGVQEPWNSLDDDGAALRLAVKRGMCVNVEGLEVGYRIGGVLYISRIVPFDGDLAAATRRAITRAAAAIGEQKQ